MRNRLDFHARARSILPSAKSVYPTSVAACIDGQMCERHTSALLRKLSFCSGSLTQCAPLESKDTLKTTLLNFKERTELLMTLLSLRNV